MAKKRWEELSPATRRLIVVGGTVEGVLKVAALVDLSRRPPSEVRGSKRTWFAAVAFINAFGGAPIAYFLFGRRRRA